METEGGHPRTGTALWTGWGVTTHHVSDPLTGEEKTLAHIHSPENHGKELGTRQGQFVNTERTFLWGGSRTGVGQLSASSQALSHMPPGRYPAPQSLHLDPPKSSTVPALSPPCSAIGGPADNTENWGLASFSNDTASSRPQWSVVQMTPAPPLQSTYWSGSHLPAPLCLCPLFLAF